MNANLNWDHSDGQFDELLQDLPRGRRPGDIGMPAQAYFESPQNVLATESLQFDARDNRESKLLVGVLEGTTVTGDRLEDGRPTRWIQGGTSIGIADDRHALTIAGSRAGKGRSALLPNLLTLPPSTSTLVIDPKGDLCRQSAWYRSEVLGQRVGVLDPFECAGDIGAKNRVAFNPIEMLIQSDQKTFVPNAKLIADALIMIGEYKDKHWDETSQQICAGLCAHVATHERYEGQRDLVTVWKLTSELASPDPRDTRRYWLEREMAENDAASGMVRSAARQFYDRTGGEFSSILSNLRKHVDWLSIECMQDVLQGESIDLKDLKRSSLALYVTLPAMRMEVLRGWLRLIVQMALAASEEERNAIGGQTVMMLDEFFILGRMQVLEAAIALLAGLHVKLWVAIQDLGQLKKNFEQNFETFIANAGMIQVLGCTDNTSLNYISKKLGDTLTLTRSTNAPTYDQATRHAATGESWTLATHPLMSGEEIGRYFGRDDRKLRQLILRPGYRPMITQRVFYDKHNMFRGRLDPHG